VFGSHGSGPKGSLIYMGWVWCEGIYSAESLTKLGHYWRRPLTQGRAFPLWELVLGPASAQRD
jgi:hypothetical protein